jgi:hypothetical protein
LVATAVGLVVLGATHGSAVSLHNQPTGTSRRGTIPRTKYGPVVSPDDTENQPLPHGFAEAIEIVRLSFPDVERGSYNSRIHEMDTDELRDAAYALGHLTCSLLEAFVPGHEFEVLQEIALAIARDQSRGE